METREATEKQKKYAYAIADALKMQRPCGNFDDFNTFISENKDEYQRYFRKQRMTDCEKYQHLPDKWICIDFGEQIADFVNDNLHKKIGIYAFAVKTEIVYIGKSYNLADRIPTSYWERRKQAAIDRILYFIVGNRTDTDLLEILLISENRPVLNVDCKNEERSTLFSSGLNIHKDFYEIPLNTQNLHIM